LKFFFVEFFFFLNFLAFPSFLSPTPLSSSLTPLPTGLMWQQIFDQIMTALFLLQIIMFGFLSIKRSASAAAVLALIPVTVLARAAIADIFREPLRAMSLRAAVDVDGVDAKELSGGGGSSSSLSASTAAKAANGGVAVDPSTAAEKLYVSPAMKFDGSNLVELKKEAATVDQILSGKVPPPALPDDGELEATKDAASEAEFQKAKKIKRQETARRAEAKRVSSASSLRKSSSNAAVSSSAAPAAAAAASAPAAAAKAAPRAAAATTSTTTEDVEAAAAPFVASSSSSAAASAAPSGPPAPVIGPSRGGDNV